MNSNIGHKNPTHINPINYLINYNINYQNQKNNTILYPNNDSNKPNINLNSLNPTTISISSKNNFDKKYNYMNPQSKIIQGPEINQNNLNNINFNTNPYLNQNQNTYINNNNKNYINPSNQNISDNNINPLNQKPFISKNINMNPPSDNPFLNANNNINPTNQNKDIQNNNMNNPSQNTFISNNINMNPPSGNPFSNANNNINPTNQNKDIHNNNMNNPSQNTFISNNINMNPPSGNPFLNANNNTNPSNQNQYTINNNINPSSQNQNINVINPNSSNSNYNIANNSTYLNPPSGTKNMIPSNQNEYISNNNIIPQNQNPSQNEDKKIIEKKENDSYKNDMITPGGEDEEALEKYYKDLENETKEDNNNNSNNNNSNNNNNKDNKDNQQSQRQNENNNNNHDLDMVSSFSFSQLKKASLVALENVGNSTYMSAVARILSNIKSIVKHYLKEKDNIKTKVQDMPLSYAFSRLIFHLYPYPQDDLKKTYSIKSFHKISLYLNPIFRGNSTKNAIDFINFLLVYLHEEDKNFLNEKNIKDNKDNAQEINSDLNSYFHFLEKNNNSIIFNTFGWINKKNKKCQRCSEEKITYQNYFTFDLDIKNAVNDCTPKGPPLNIYECIQYATKKKTFENKYCESCKEKQVLESENSIVISPNYFIFILRLNDDGFKTINKLESKFGGISIEEKLMLSDIIKDQNINNNYKLVGMVVYYFNIVNGQNIIEYKTYCSSPIDNKWYKYDNDEKYNISKINLNEILKPSKSYPVILIYKAIKN